MQLIYTILKQKQTKKKLNKHIAEPYLIFDDQIEEMEKFKQKQNKQTKINRNICMHKYCLQPFLAEMKHLVKKCLTSYVC